MVKSCVLALLYQIGVWATYLGYPVWVIYFWLHSLGYVRYTLKPGTYNIRPTLFRRARQHALGSLPWHLLRMFRKLNHTLFDLQEGSITV